MSRHNAFRSFASFAFALALLTTQARGDVSCTLTATPQPAYVNENVTLTVTPSIPAQSGFINNQRVTMPGGALTLTSATPGLFSAHSMVLIDHLEYFCDTSYLISPAIEAATLVGDVVSAATGLPLPGVSLSLIPGGAATTSNAGGAFTFANVALGGFTVTAALSGYTTETYSNVAVPGQNPPIHIVMNPILPDGQLRVVLTWGAVPTDLDSHLFTTWATGQTFHIYYPNRTSTNTTLDVDDTSSFGPETVTVLDQTPGRYSYAVFDYTNGFTGRGGNGQISIGDAVVKVYQGANLINEFHPTNTGGEIAWHVFDADISATGALTIIPRDNYSNTDLDAVATFP